MATPPLNAVLSDLLGQFRATEPDFRALLDTLSETQLRWNPEPTRWSIAQNLAHLVVINEDYVESCRVAIAKGRAKGQTGTPPYRYNWLSRYAAAKSEPPVKMRFKAPRTMHPPAHIDLDALYPRFVAAHDGFATRMAEADGLDLGRVKVGSPASKLIRFSLGGAWALLAAHNRRHLWTANQIRQRPDFPKA